MSDDGSDDNKDGQLLNSSSSQDVASTLQPTFRERRAHFSPFGEPLPPGEEEEPELPGRGLDDSPDPQRESQFPRSSSSYDVVDHRQLPSHQRHTFLPLSEDLTPQRRPPIHSPLIPRSRGTNDLAAMNEPLPPAFYPQATEIFTAAPGQEADRWWGRTVGNLRRNGVTNSGETIREIYLLLGGEPGKWAKRDYVVKVIFDRNHTATQDEVEVVREAFVEKWQEEEDEDDRSGAISELETLKQGGDESLRAYYHRALHLCRAAGGEDSVRPSSAAAGSIQDSTITHFRRGLHNDELKRKVGGPGKASDGTRRTLTSTYGQAEEGIRALRDDAEERERSQKEQELTMLRAFAAASMTSTASPQLKQQVSLLMGVAPPVAHTALQPVVVQVQPRPATQQEAPPVTLAAPPAPYVPAVHNPAPYAPAPPRPASVPAGANPSTGIGMSATSTSPYRRAMEASTQQHGAAFTPAHSPNQYVNGYSTYKFSPTGLLCTKCGVVGHIGPECTNEPLSRPERDFLFNLTTFQREEGRARAAARMDGQPFNANLVSVEFEDERTAQVNEVEFSVLLDEGSNKRPRTDGEEEEPQTQTQCQHRGEGGEPGCNAGTCDHDCCKPSIQRPKKPVKKSARPKQKKPLKPIVARTAEAPLDILTILKTASVTMDITKLAQLSPYFRDETKRLLSMPRQRRAKKGAAATPAVASTVTFEAEVRQVMFEIAQDIQEFCKKDRTNRAFSLPAKVWKADKANAVTVARNRVAADQGSDINLIYPELRKRLGLELISTKKLQMPNMSMTVADGSKCYLDHYTVLNIEVSGIERSAWAFVCPTQTKKLDLLLGIPYLSSVKAKIDISNNSIEIGDKKRDESRVKVRTPEVKPVSPKITTRSEESTGVVEVEESGDDDEDDDEESNEDAEDEDETSDEEDTSEDETSEGERDF